MPDARPDLTSCCHVCKQQKPFIIGFAIDNVMIQYESISISDPGAVDMVRISLTVSCSHGIILHNVSNNTGTVPSIRASIIEHRHLLRYNCS